MQGLFSTAVIFCFLATFTATSFADNRAEPRNILVTGSTSGLGREVALSLVDSGDHVIIHGRNKERGAALVAQLNAKRAGSARFFAADFSALSQVRALAANIAAHYDHLDVLVNNAGIVRVNDPQRRISDDGHELHFQVNYLAGFLLTDLLLPLLEKNQAARVVNVSSLAAAPLDFDNLMLEQGYSANRAYGQSKLAQVMYTIDLSKKLQEKGITVNALHPESYMNTRMVLSAGLQPRSSVADGRDAVLQLINKNDVGNGEFYNVLNLSTANPQAYDAKVRTQLWDASLQLIAEAKK